MSLADDPWELPSVRTFLEEIAALLDTGGGTVMGGPSLPADHAGAIRRFLERRHFMVEHVDHQHGREPAEQLAGRFVVSADVESLAANTNLTDHVAVVAPNGGEQEWALFLARFLRTRSRQAAGLSVLLLLPDAVLPSENLPQAASWAGRLRRLDATIWADLNEPARRRDEPLASLAASLAVELGGWRLDLVAAIAQAAYEELLDPLGVLEGWRGRAIEATDNLDGEAMRCSVALLEAGDRKQLELRLWRAQLRALFPWIEELRQKVIDRYRRHLRYDPHLRQLGARGIEDIEFGGIHYQLRDRIAPHEANLLESLAQLRNDLAHRKPVRGDDLDRVLQGHWRLR